MFLFAIVLGWLALVFTQVTSAQDSALPPYCKARFERDVNYAEYKKWEDRYGPGFLHIHHLCHGISALNKAYRAINEQERRGLLDRAMSEFSYVVNHVDPTFGLLSDLYLYRSEVHRLRRNEAFALKDLLLSLSIDPKQTKAYIAAADLYAKQDQKNKALSIVETGLRHLPDSKSLRNKYIALGGDIHAAMTAEPGRDQYGPDRSGATPLVDDPSRPKLSTADSVKAAEPINKALYSFSRPGHGGMQHRYNAGEHVYLEVSEDPKSGENTVLFRFISMIPERHSRIGSIGIDLGRYVNMFTRFEPDTYLGIFYPIRLHMPPYRHAFWPGFSAHYHSEATIDPKIAKPNDPRKMSPGNTLTYKAYLSPGVRYEDVIQALNRGLTADDGLRVAIIALHLAGPPLPSGTRSDDGGYFTGRLIKTQGPYFEYNKQQGPVMHAPDAVAPPEQTRRPPHTESAPPSFSSGDALNPKKPWCRFCPAE